LAFAVTLQDIEDPVAMYAFLLVNHCIGLHNTVIDDLQNSMLGGNRAHTLPSLTHSQVHARDMLDFRPDLWQAELSRAAWQSLEYGRGKMIGFDYKRLCEWVYTHLLGARSQVSGLVESFKFAGEPVDLTGALAGIEQVDIDVEVSTAIFTEFKSMGEVRQCLDRVKQCRGFLQMVQALEDCPLGQFAEVTLGLSSEEMKHLGEPVGAVRSSVMLSNLRDLEAKLTERLLPDVLDDLHEMYLISIPEELKSKFHKAAYQMPLADLSALIDGIVGLLRKQFAKAKIHEYYSDRSENAAQSLFERIIGLLVEIPSSHPEINELHEKDIYEFGALPSACEVFDGTTDGWSFTPNSPDDQLKICHLGSCLAVLRQVHGEILDPPQTVTALTLNADDFTQAKVGDRISIWEQRLAN
jgi:hypothetical protein